MLLARPRPPPHALTEVTASRPIDAVRPLDRTPSSVYRTITHQVTAGGMGVGCLGCGGEERQCKGWCGAVLKGGSGKQWSTASSSWRSQKWSHRIHQG